jgi:cell division protein FtsB
MVVVPHRPFLTWGLRIGAVVSLVVGTIGGYYAGYHKVARQLESLQATTREQEQALKSLEERNAQLTQQLTNVKTGIDIDNKANDTIREQLQKTEAENVLYRSIMNPNEEEDKSPAFSEWSLTPNAKEGEFTFKIAVKQFAQATEWTKGELKININGTAEGKDTTLNYTQLATGESKTLPVRFKYFQVITGTLQLPDNFEPKGIIVSLVVHGKKKESFTQHYDWPAPKAATQD